MQNNFVHKYKELKNTNLEKKNILIREDYNVPIANNEIINDARIKASIPTIKYILSKGAKISLLSHFGRPTEGVFEKKYSLEKVAARLSEILDKKVFFEKKPLDVSSPEYKNDITLYENTRFLVGEKSGNKNLAKKIAKNCDVFVMDAFGVSHRKHTSNYTISEYAPVTCAGLLLMNEIFNLEKIFNNPKKPILAIIGGAKVSTKLNILKELINKVDSIIVGGGIANTFLLSSGFSIGKSLVEKDLVLDAKKIINLAKKKNVAIPFPVDAICEYNGYIKKKDIKDIGPEGSIKDIGPNTCEIYKKYIEEAGTIIWNGPLGVFENVLFENGTKSIAKFISKANGISVIGG